MSVDREPRDYPTDDADDDRDGDLVLRISMSGNGDWYVSILPKRHRIGPTVRVTTSGARSQFAGVAPAIADVYDALGGKPRERLRAFGDLEDEIERLTASEATAFARAEKAEAERDDARSPAGIARAFFELDLADPAIQAALGDHLAGAMAAREVERRIARMPLGDVTQGFIMAPFHVPALPKPPAGE